jgi:hypothetical protein
VPSSAAALAAVIVPVDSAAASAAATRKRTAARERRIIAALATFLKLGSKSLTALKSPPKKIHTPAEIARSQCGMGLSEVLVR